MRAFLEKFFLVLGVVYILIAFDVAVRLHAGVPLLLNSGVMELVLGSLLAVGGLYLLFLMDELETAGVLASWFAWLIRTLAVIEVGVTVIVATEITVFADWKSVASPDELLLIMAVLIGIHGAVMGILRLGRILTSRVS